MLAVYSPAARTALGPPATPDELARLETDLGFVLHPDLRALLERNNGLIETRHGDFIEQPGAFLPLRYQLLDTAVIASDHRWCVGFGAENIASGLREDSLFGHAHQWVPIARSIDAGVLFIDHRPEPTYGHVYEAGIGSGAIDGTLWGSSLAAFFDTIASVLNARTDFQDFRPEVYESELSEETLLTSVL
ncbi:SMI1/KNR4 family protein [Nocardia sp. NPDC004278]